MISFKTVPDKSKDIEDLLNPIIKKWFFTKFKNFSLPQLYGVTEVHSRNNILLSANTGSGKTLTAFISILNELIDSSEKGILEDKVYAVYVSPLKALSNDIHVNLINPLEEMQSLAEKEFGIRVAVRTGDTTPSERQKMLKHPPHILITTPESLSIMLSSVKFSDYLKDIQWTIVDEVHSLAENKRGVHLSLILEQLQRLSPGMCRVGLSATIAPLESVAQFLVGSERDCKIIDVQFMKKSDLQVISAVDDFVNTTYEKIENATYNLMDKLIQEHKTTLIFTNTRAATERIVHHLKDRFPEKYKAIDDDTKEELDLIGAHHGSLSREHRLKLENSLREGKLKAVVCLEGNTKILTSTGEWVKIKELYQEQVQSLNLNLRLNNNPIITRILKENRDSLVKLKTSCGKEITSTKEHKFLTINSFGVIEWKEANHLIKDDYIATIRNYSYQKFLKSELDIFTLDNYPDNGFVKISSKIKEELKELVINKYGTLKGYWRQNIKNGSYSQFRSYFHNNLFKVSILKNLMKILKLDKQLIFDNILYISSDKSCTPKITFSVDFMRLLGFMMAEGYISNTGFFVSNRNPKVLEYYSKLLEKVSGKKPFFKLGSTGTPIYVWYSVFLSNFLKSLGFISGRKSRISKLPSFFFRLDSNLIFSFLSGYFDGDGYVENKTEDNRVYSAGIVTTSKKMVNDLSLLLIREGILNSVRSKYVDSVQLMKDGREIIKKGWFYDVCILGGENLRKFAKNISPIRDNIFKVKSILDLNGYCNLDVVPNLGSKIKEYRKKNHISNYHLSKNGKTDLSKYELGMRNISRNKLKEIYYYFETKEDYFLDLANSDIFWERINSKEIIKPTNYVYNIEVQNDHNYIANGFVTKNCSTSLELGVDIGSIDLVICLGSPKSVARFLQRGGRANHALDGITKGRLLVTDRDDLVECSVLLKYAIEKNIDRIHIPTNCLDVLAQQIFGMVLQDVWNYDELFMTIKSSYCYKDLTKKDFDEVLDYLAGNFISLEERHIYARIWWDKENNQIGKRGKMSRIIYMTNIGTIPDQQGVLVKDARGNKIGMIDEMFLEKLDRGDIFVLGGNTYQFNYARGMVASVTAMPNKKPTVPSWYSDRLPLSYDLAKGICNFRLLMEEKFKKKLSKKEMLEFINSYLFVDNTAAEAIYNYFKDQYDYIGLPTSKKIILESYRDEQMKNYVIFHTLYGRRVNDVLSRAVAFAITRSQHKDVEIGISDNGFYVVFERNVDVKKAFALLKSSELKKVLDLAIDKSEILKRRFRHCAGRSLMILRTYGGVRKHIGRQQVSSTILLNAVKRISENFFILKETRREILEDLMDFDSALEVLKEIEDRKIKIEEVQTFIPSPFSLNLVMQGFSDILKMEDKQQFIQRMHQMVKAKIALKQR